MKLKYNFVINQLGDSFIAVPVADLAVEFNGVLKLNESAAYIVEQLNSEIAYEDLCAKVAANFSAADEDAKANVDKILEGLKGANLLVG